MSVGKDPIPLEEPTTKGDAPDGGKLGDLMEDIENEFAELDELLKDVNLGQDSKPKNDYL